jgi:hypothetical protein
LLFDNSLLPQIDSRRSGRCSQLAIAGLLVGTKTIGNDRYGTKSLSFLLFFLENEIDTILSEMNTAPIFWQF